MRVVAAHAPAEWLIAVVVEHQVRVSAGTMQPAFNPLVIFPDCSGDGHLGGRAIRVGGIGRNRFPIETLAQVGIALPNMALERMAALILIARQVIASRRLKSYVLDGFRGSLRWFRTAMKKEVRENDEQNDNRQTSQPFAFHGNILLTVTGLARTSSVPGTLI